MSYIYQHIRLDNNQIFYIGIGGEDNSPSTNYGRAYSHNSRNKHWHNIVNKVGFKVEILFENLNWEDACLKEIEFIKQYGRMDLKTGILVNMTEGGEGVPNPSEETRKKKSNSIKNIYKNNPNIFKDVVEKRNITYQNNPEIMEKSVKKRLQTFNDNPEIQINRVKNMDWISIGKKISKNRNTEKLSASLKKPIIQCDIQGNPIQEWSSGKEIKEKLGISSATICLVCKGKGKTAGGYKWKYKEV